MPCRDDFPNWSIPSTEHNTINAISVRDKEIAKLEAMLCALATHIESVLGFWPDVDWNSSGVTYEEFTEWWEAHKAKDQKRIENEKKVLDEFMKANGFNEEYLKKLLDK